MTAPPAGALEACLALLEKATPGEWEAGSCDGGWDAVRESGGKVLCKMSLNHPANADAIAAAVNYLRQHGPALLAALRLREGCQRLEQRWRDRENFDCYVRSDEQFSGVLRGRGICADDLARVLEEG